MAEGAERHTAEWHETEGSHRPSAIPDPAALTENAVVRALRQERQPQDQKRRKTRTDKRMAHRRRVSEASRVSSTAGCDMESAISYDPGEGENGTLTPVNLEQGRLGRVEPSNPLAHTRNKVSKP